MTTSWADRMKHQVRNDSAYPSRLRDEAETVLRKYRRVPSLTAYVQAEQPGPVKNLWFARDVLRTAAELAAKQPERIYARRRPRRDPRPDHGHD